VAERPFAVASQEEQPDLSAREQESLVRLEYKGILQESGLGIWATALGKITILLLENHGAGYNDQVTSCQNRPDVQQ
jgi:hypothetical protein